MVANQKANLNTKNIYTIKFTRLKAKLSISKSQNSCFDMDFLSTIITNPN
jgi:hypothetical protein